MNIGLKNHNHYFHYAFYNQIFQIKKKESEKAENEHFQWSKECKRKKR